MIGSLRSQFRLWCACGLVGLVACVGTEMPSQPDSVPDAGPKRPVATAIGDLPPAELARLTSIGCTA